MRTVKAGGSNQVLIRWNTDQSMRGFALEELCVQCIVGRVEFGVDENASVRDCFQWSRTFVWKTKSDEQLQQQKTWNLYKEIPVQWQWTTNMEIPVWWPLKKWKPKN